MSTMAWRRVGPGRWERGPKQPGARWVPDDDLGWKNPRPIYEKPAPIDKAALVVAIAALPAELEKKIMHMPVVCHCKQPLSRKVVMGKAGQAKKGGYFYKLTVLARGPQLQDDVYVSHLPVPLLYRQRVHDSWYRRLHVPYSLLHGPGRPRHNVESFWFDDREHADIHGADNRGTFFRYARILQGAWTARGWGGRSHRPVMNTHFMDRLRVKMARHTFTGVGTA